MNISISQLQLGKSKEKEIFRVINQLTQQARLRYETTARGATLGAGAYVTLWSTTIPQDTSWVLEVMVIGRGTTGGASYEMIVGVQDFGGTVSVIGGTAQITFAREDNVAMDATFGLTGSVLTLDVRDDAVQPMNWTAWISSIGSG